MTTNHVACRLRAVEHYDYIWPSIIDNVIPRDEQSPIYHLDSLVGDEHDEEHTGIYR